MQNKWTMGSTRNYGNTVARKLSQGEAGFGRRQAKHALVQKQGAVPVAPRLPGPAASPMNISDPEH
jgi:hypothetical protein